jgi:glycogen debranching enzyme
MRTDDVRILDGSTFLVSGPEGDVGGQPDQVQGLFFRDMRHLSTWRLVVNGRPLKALSVHTPGYESATFFLTPPSGTIYRNPTLSVMRQRLVGDGMRETLWALNSGPAPVTIEVSLLVDADFADILEVKDAHTPDKNVYRRVEDDVLILGYAKDDFVRETHVHAPGAALTTASLTYRLTLEPAQWSHSDIEVVVKAGDDAPSPKRAKPDGRHGQPNMAKDLQSWINDSPELTTSWDALRHTYGRSLQDLAALRFYPMVVPGSASLPAAGLPWFMALFGRDSLIASYQALPFQPELAATTLRALAARQATESDDFRDADPGKILHELRFGDQAHFGKMPQSPYYGSADSTPLFLILLDEYERWTGDQTLVRDLERPARAALRWLEQYGDVDGDGYIEYQRRNTSTGLVNQCWKDSWNSILHPDGSLASQPRATCELQGYAYDARRRFARLARTVWNDDALGQRVDRDAEELRRRFNHDYWLDDVGCFALALDGDKQRVRTIASNAGQLLWSGIVDEDKLDPLVATLMGDDMFSGWGVRTLAAGQHAYNPIEYHNGTVWPHDNALIAAGLARYGRHDEAGRIALGILQAASFFDYRLPEVFAGYPRARTEFPVEYPTACSPQAWASGTPLLLLRVLLGLEPGEHDLNADPHVPNEIGDLRLDRVPFRRGCGSARG